MYINKALLAMSLGLSLAACAGLNTKHQQIAASCEAVASSADAVAAGVRAGKVTPAQQAEAVRIYKTTVPFCQPVADNLDPVKQAVLALAVAKLSELAGVAK